MRYLKHKLTYITACFLIVFVGCDNAPRVRLVRDNDETYHFQWDEPLKEERINLVRFGGVEVIHNDYSSFFPQGRPFTQRKHHREYPMEYDFLVYFPARSFVSAPLYKQEITEDYGLSSEHTRSVEIMPAHLRNTGYFPARLRAIIVDRGFEVHDQVILRDHPFFREYRVDKPSHLDFTAD